VIRKKLIEVALPLEAINQESAREKSIRHGHPSTLYLWWARRPTEEAQAEERQRLLTLLEKLAKWENASDPDIVEAARAEILKSTDGNPPSILDPFCGGGSIPLEVQRLGLEAHASDINPVAVLITKAMIEIPPKFGDLPPVNSESRQREELGFWKGAQGLAEDVRYYGKWLSDEAEKRIGHLYPKIQLPVDQGGGEATVIAWLWARTVECPNPACRCRMPLVKSLNLSIKKGREVCVKPVLKQGKSSPSVQFEVCPGLSELTEGTVGRRGGFCISCETPVPLDYIRSEGKAKRMDVQLISVIAEGKRGRVYLSPDKRHVEISKSQESTWKPDVALPTNNPRNFNTLIYGLNTISDLFTERQLLVLETLSELVKNTVQNKVLDDAVAVGMEDNHVPLDQGGLGAKAYAEAITTYLALSVDRLADRSSTICSWDSSRDSIRNTFARQAIPMTWDFAEVNPFSSSTGNFKRCTQWIVGVLENLPANVQKGVAQQKDARTPFDFKEEQLPIVFTTDPPYYDNISYAELSDFFYVWLRRSLNNIYPNLFSTISTPKEAELIAAPHRHGGNKNRAKDFFEQGLGQAFYQIKQVYDLADTLYRKSNPDYPFSVFYAFKQTEKDRKSKDGVEVTASTGWEAMLEGLIKAGFSITGTWPMRTELSNRTVASSSNALASSIVLVCRPLSKNAPKVTHRDFLVSLRQELPPALRAMQQGNIAPVDLAQASIGPGMAVFSRYAAVLEADGSPMGVRTALQMINQILDEYMAEQEGEFDTDTCWALTWFEQYQYEVGDYGVAETLSKAKNTSVQGLVESGILTAQSGKVRLLSRTDLQDNWNPQADDRLPDWEATQHLIRALDQQGEMGAAKLLAQLNGQGETARDLAYRLYSLCDRKGWSQEGTAYNSLVTAWTEISRLANEMKSTQTIQTELKV
jgi:putative DNA methylase